ncbi:protein lethal(2)essential for life-like [Ostrinia furnacalis]|uniref:protein lethal(2)essential for life-like n=1 Tax=Ostrinia furnacalis TaxID=93504 RepID=UPI00103C45A3|nr:protein lethal(2)essential for life-like [Ostrinia furnacalis]
MTRDLFSPFGDEVVLRSIDWLENFPWRQENLATKKDSYEVHFNVKGFAPEEISVKTADGYIVLEAFHDEKKDEFGYISRKLIRRYPLPDDCVKEDVLCKLSSDGILTVKAPRKLVKNNTVIPVTHEGAVKAKL